LTTGGGSGGGCDVGVTSTPTSDSNVRHYQARFDGGQGGGAGFQVPPHATSALADHDDTHKEEAEGSTSSSPHHALHDEKEDQREHGDAQDRNQQNDWRQYRDAYRKQHQQNQQHQQQKQPQQQGEHLSHEHQQQQEQQHQQGQHYRQKWSHYGQQHEQQQQQDQGRYYQRQYGGRSLLSDQQTVNQDDSVYGEAISFGGGGGGGLHIKPNGRVHWRQGATDDRDMHLPANISQWQQHFGERLRQCINSGRIIKVVGGGGK
jgi:flagellar biosynthesis GTPase FlhF